MSRLPVSKKSCGSSSCGRGVRETSSKGRLIGTQFSATTCGPGPCGKSTGTSSSKSLLVKTESKSQNVTTKRSASAIKHAKSAASKPESVAPKTAEKAPCALCGEYNVPAYGPETARGKDQIFSSPPDLRSRMSKRVPSLIQASTIRPSSSRGVQPLQQHPQTRDIISGSFRITPSGSCQPYAIPRDTFLDYTMTPTMVAEQFAMSPEPYVPGPAFNIRTPPQPRPAPQRQERKPYNPFLPHPCWNFMSPPGSPREGSPLPGPSTRPSGPFSVYTPPPRPCPVRPSARPLPQAQSPYWSDDDSTPSPVVPGRVKKPGAIRIMDDTPPPSHRPQAYGADRVPHYHTPPPFRLGFAPSPVRYHDVTPPPSPYLLQSDFTPPPRHGTPGAGYAPAYMDSSALQQDLERQVMEQSMRSHGASRVHGSSMTTASPPVIMTDRGPVQATEQLVLERRVSRTPEMEHVSKHMTGFMTDASGRATRAEINIQDVEHGMYSHHPKQVVKVVSSITVGPDVVQKSESLLMEQTKLSGDRGGTVLQSGKRTPQLSPHEVSKLIEEETVDVDHALLLEVPEVKRTSPATYPIRKKIHSLRLSSASMARLEQSVTSLREQEAPEAPAEEIQPEVVAAIIHTEERGMCMDVPPNKLYNYLFPQSKDEPVISISSAAPAPLQDVVIPTAVPSEIHKTVQQLERTAKHPGIQSQENQPTDSIFSQSFVDKGAPEVSNIAVKKKRKMKIKNIPIISAEQPPWDLDELQPIMDIVGAAPSTTLTVTDASMMEHTMASEGIEYLLVPEPPRHISRVQLRGSQKPPWFPGYYVALPDLPGIIQISKSPTTVLASAWKAVEPKYFPDDSFTFA